MAGYYEQHDKMYVSVDCIIFGFDKGELKVLICHRGMDPGRGEWSIYGGFVKNDESVDEAAHRVLNELTGIGHVYMRQVGAFGKVDRDPGERVVSIAYYALINVIDYDDSLRKQYELEWVNINHLPNMYSDHISMINTARRMMKEKIKCEPISFNLLPPLFTLTQLQQLYEAVLGYEVDKRNFRKRVKEMDFIEKTDMIDKSTSKRGAFLYRFNRGAYMEEPYFKL